MSRGRGNAGLPLLIIALLLHTSRAQNDTSSPVATTQATSLPITGAACTLNADGSYSGAGTCTGPVQRSEVRYGNLSITNGGCPADQLLFYVDGDMAQPKCGECKPGVSGLEDAQLACGINDFCDDNGRCRSAKSSPLYDQPCPYEQGGLTRYGWCGPGLRCIGHRCAVCTEGVLDPSDGKRCVNGEWTYSPWVALVYNPSAVFQLCTLLVLVIYLLFLVIRHTPIWPAAVRWGRRLGQRLRKWWQKIEMPKVTVPFVSGARTPAASTTPANTSTDVLADNMAPSPANQSIEMEEIENYLQANAEIRND